MLPILFSWLEDSPILADDYWVSVFPYYLYRSAGLQYNLVMKTSTLRKLQLSVKHCSVHLSNTGCHEHIKPAYCPLNGLQKIVNQVQGLDAYCEVACWSRPILKDWVKFWDEDRDWQLHSSCTKVSNSPGSVSDLNCGASCRLDPEVWQQW